MRDTPKPLRKLNDAIRVAGRAGPHNAVDVALCVLRGDAPPLLLEHVRTRPVAYQHAVFRSIERLTPEADGIDRIKALAHLRIDRMREESMRAIERAGRALTEERDA